MINSTPAGEGKIRRSDLFNIRFYQKSPFHGSFLGMHYRIEGITGESGEKRLKVTTWPGPYNFDHTEESRKESALFAFSNQGLDAVADYLTQYHRERYT